MNCCRPVVTELYSWNWSLDLENVLHLGGLTITRHKNYPTSTCVSLFTLSYSVPIRPKWDLVFALVLKLSHLNHIVVAFALVKSVNDI